MNERKPRQGRKPQVHDDRDVISLHIEHMVIEGVPLSAGQAGKLRAALQQELMRLLQRDGLGGADQSGAVPMLAAPAIAMSLPFHPVQAGRQIARSIYGSLTGRA